MTHLTKITLTITAALFLGGCMSAGTADVKTPEEVAIAGKTLVNEGATFAVNTDGTMTGQLKDGTPVVASWAFQDGKWCRTITAPERLAGSACQDVTVEGDQATFLRADGSSQTYTIQ